MNQPPDISELPPAPAPMSLSARLLNVFAVPGEVFENVKTSKLNAANWIVPALLMGFIGAIGVFIMLSQPAVVQRIQEQQARPFEKKVEAGELSRAEADQQIEAVQRIGLLMAKVAGPIGAFVGGFIQVFWWALVLWLIAKVVFHVPLNFMKVVEVAGLAGMITVLEKLITLLLVVSFSNPLAAPNLAMLLQNPDPESTTYIFLSQVNIMSLWAVAVRAIGLARLSGVSFARSMVWLTGLWLTAMLLLAGLHLAFVG